MSIADSVHAKVTEGFIMDNPSDVALERGTRIKTSAGGYVWTKTDDLLPVRGRMIFSGNKGDNIRRTLPDGSVLVVTATLVMMPGADVETGDRATVDGMEYTIGNVQRVPAWRVSCEAGQHA